MLQHVNRLAHWIVVNCYRGLPKGVTPWKRTKDLVKLNAELNA
jgi:hypothetical protein